MKAKVNSRTVGNSLAGGEKKEKGKHQIPEKKEKNIKRAFYQEIEEEEDLDYQDIKRKTGSIIDYYDDGTPDDDDLEEEDEDDENDD